MALFFAKLSQPAFHQCLVCLERPAYTFPLSALEVSPNQKTFLVVYQHDYNGSRETGELAYAIYGQDLWAGISRQFVTRYANLGRPQTREPKT